MLDYISSRRIAAMNSPREAEAWSIAALLCRRRRIEVETRIFAFEYEERGVERIEERFDPVAFALIGVNWIALWALVLLDLH